jgi:hypothetical protein
MQPKFVIGTNGKEADVYVFSSTITHATFPYFRALTDWCEAGEFLCVSAGQVHHRDASKEFVAYGESVSLNRVALEGDSDLVNLLLQSSSKRDETHLVRCDFLGDAQYSASGEHPDFVLVSLEKDHDKKEYDEKVPSALLSGYGVIIYNSRGLEMPLGQSAWCNRTRYGEPYIRPLATGKAVYLKHGSGQRFRYDVERLVPGLSMESAQKRIAVTAPF